jgi:hypothetical protein
LIHEAEGRHIITKIIGGRTDNKTGNYEARVSDLYGWINGGHMSSQRFVDTCLLVFSFAERETVVAALLRSNKESYSNEYHQKNSYKKYDRANNKKSLSSL